MPSYWCIIEELRYVGEIVVLRDPGLQRQYYCWLRKNGEGVAFSREIGVSAVVSQGLKDLSALTSLN